MNWLGLVLLVCGVGGCLFVPPVRGALVHGLQSAQTYLQAFPGFVESFSLIFMSELGDKTFFIAALLAMRVGRTISFLGSVFSLTMMTVISVAIGRLFAQVPQFMDTSAPVGQYVGATLLVYFGVKSILAGLQAEDDTGEELAEAEEEMQEAEKSGKMKGSTWVAKFSEVASLIFVAEWGDRSMLATIALAVQSDPVGVACGASMGHVVATVIAVIAGSLASKYISEKMVNIVGGVLFLLFAAETALGLGIL